MSRFGRRLFGARGDAAAPLTAAPVELHQEEALGRAYDARIVRRLWAFLRPYRHLFWLSVLCLPISSGLMLVQPYLLKLAIDRHVAVGDASGLATLGMLYIAAIIGECAFFYAQYYLTMLVAQRSLADLRVRVFAHVQQLPMSYFDRNPIGRLVTRLTSDVDVLNEMFAAGAMTIFMDVLTMVGIIAIMLSINVRLALTALAVMPFMLIGINYFRLAARRTYRLIRERIARLNAYLQEALSGMMIIQLFAAERRCFDEFDALNDAHREANHWSNVYEAALFSMVELLASVAAALMIWYGAGGIRSGVIAFGTLVAFIEYIQRFFIPIREFSTKYAVMQSAMASAERVFQLLDTEPAIVSPRVPRLPKRATGGIEFDRVWFAYKGEDFVLRDVSFRVEPGEKIAIVGATGSGKTSLIKLLSRFYDVSRGQIRVDGIDVREWDLSQLRRHIGTVLQDVFLFSGDVASNIGLGRPEITPAMMEEAARRVNALPFIRALPGGFAEKVRERGSNLSTGQRQLLAFARALAYNPTILVLDEATSSVDTETELLIQDALTTLMRDRTALVIAHRLSTIEHSDRIVVLHHGAVREIGTHQELIEAQGIYYRLHQLQYVPAEPAGAPRVATRA
jgi:ABC-type multidrug transport system fused ATPase/permease subunit